jgi:hypothetical protein
VSDPPSEANFVISACIADPSANRVKDQKGMICWCIHRTSREAQAAGGTGPSATYRRRARPVNLAQKSAWVWHPREKVMPYNRVSDYQK